MQLEHIDIGKLKISACNMRYRDPPPDVSDILPSIRARGILEPLVIRPENGRYGVVAGRRRYFSAKAVKDECGEIAPLPCAIMEDGDDAAAIEASLLENVARRDADPMKEHETFVRLIKEGRTIEGIGATFGMTNTMVKQRLALGNLLPKIRDAYRAEEIDDETVRHLTLASPGQQKKWLRLFADPKEYAPRGAQLKQWLFGGQEISTKAALFPLTDYTGQTVTDLFGEESYFADADLFWALQNRAIVAKREALLKAGWGEVNVLEIGQHFATWEHEKTPKKKGGKVFITVSHDGEVEVFDGWLSQKEARRLAKSKDAEKKGGKPVSADATTKRAVTKAMENYLELHRQSAVRLALIANPTVAFRLAVALMVASSGNWNVKPDPQQTRSNAVRDSIAKGRAQAAFEAEHDAVFALLALPDSDDDLNGLRGSDGKTVAVFARLLTLTDTDVQRIAAFVMAETVAVGSAVVEAVGTHLAVDASANWQPDDTFFDLIRDRSTLNAMVAEVAGETVAASNVAEKGKTQKQIVRDCLTGGNGRVKTENWQPGWLAFPFRGYGDGPCAIAEAARAARENLG